MFFFKNGREDSGPTAKSDSHSQLDKRDKPRYSVGALFEPGVTLFIQSNAGSQAPDAGAPSTLSWKCRLLDCSEQGVRVQLETSLKIPASELRGLRLKVTEYNVDVPCRIVNVGIQEGKEVLGLLLEFEDDDAFDAYWELLEIVALGSGLKLHAKTSRPDDSGYLVEHYASNRPARLSVWRQPVDRAIVAFEFRVKRYVVRAVAGYPLEYFLEPGKRPAPAQQQRAIQLQFSGMAANLSQTVPADVQAMLHYYVVSRGESTDLKRHTA